MIVLPYIFKSIGNLDDPKFLKTISGLNIKSVICFNLLEHIVNKEETCQNVTSIIHYSC